MSKRRLRKLIYQLGSGGAETGTSSRPWFTETPGPLEPLRSSAHGPSCCAHLEIFDGLHWSVFLAPSTWKASVQIAAMEIFVRLFLNTVILIIILARLYKSLS